MGASGGVSYLACVCVLLLLVLSVAVRFGDLAGWQLHQKQMCSSGQEEVKLQGRNLWQCTHPMAELPRLRIQLKRLELYRV